MQSNIFIKFKAHLLDVGVEWGAVGAVDRVTLRVVPEAELLLVVVGVDGGEGVGVPRPREHAVLAQVRLPAAVLQQEQSEPAQFTDRIKCLLDESHESGQTGKYVENFTTV